MTINNPATILYDVNGNALGNSGNPLYMSGSVGISAPVAISNFPAVQQVTGSLGVTIANFPTVQPTLVTNLNVDPQQRLRMVGPILSGSAADVTAAPVVIAGVDTNNIIRTLLTDPTGKQIVFQKSTTPTVTSVAASATSVMLLAANASRQGATVFNDGNSTIYVKLGAAAATTSYTVKVTSQGYYELPYGYTGEVDALWANANGSARITELL